MLSFPGAGSAPIYLYAGVADMRKSFDGLLGLIEQAGMADAQQALSGAWFVFRNRRSDRLKILYFDAECRCYARRDAPCGGDSSLPSLERTAVRLGG